MPEMQAPKVEDINSKQAQFLDQFHPDQNYNYKQLSLNCFTSLLLKPQKTLPINPYISREI